MLCCVVCALQSSGSFVNRGKNDSKAFVKPFRESLKSFMHVIIFLDDFRRSLVWLLKLLHGLMLKLNGVVPGTEKRPPEMDCFLSAAVGDVGVATAAVGGTAGGGGGGGM